MTYVNDNEQDAATPVAIDNPFALDRLRLSPNYGANLGVKKVLTTVPVRKPDKQWWIRVHPDEAWRIDTAVIELKEEGEIYLVDRSLWDGLTDEIVPVMLFTAITARAVFLWPVGCPTGPVRNPGTSPRTWPRPTAHEAPGFAS